MKQVMKLMAALLCLMMLAACGESGGSAPEAMTDGDLFFAAYNAAAAQVGCVVLEEADLGPYTVNGEEMDGFIVDSSVMEASMLSFTPGQIMLVCRPTDFDEFYLETQAVLMAALELDLEEAEELAFSLYFDEDASSRDTVAGTQVIEKTITKNGVKLRIANSSGILTLMFTA